MYCINCGNECKEGSKFCSQCGGVLESTIDNEDCVSDRRNSREVLASPLHNFCCFVCVGCLTYGIPGTVKDLINRNFVSGILSVCIIIASCMSYILLIRNMKYLLGKISILALILAPVKGFVSMFYFVFLCATAIAYCIPIIGYPFALLYSFIVTITEKISYLRVYFDENGKGRVCLL